MTYEVVLTELRDGVQYVTLNRPERLNALSQQLQEELVDAVLAAEADEAVGSIVIRGAGRAFCSGFDITPRPPDESRATIRKDIIACARSPIAWQRSGT
jgi:enoyl-CoA hydratase/carnithine racemase